VDALIYLAYRQNFQTASKGFYAAWGRAYDCRVPYKEPNKTNAALTEFHYTVKQQLIFDAYYP
jgi:hypothetical protein